jgi:hypothetical protein
MNVPMKVNPNDGWKDAAAEAEKQLLRGSLLKFADWNWSVGKEGTPIEKDRQLVAISTTVAWVRWEDNKPSEYRVKGPGEPLPEREELGDLDEALWDAGPDGRPRDP